MKQHETADQTEPVTEEASPPPRPLVMNPKTEDECRRYAGPEGGVFKAGPVYVAELLRELDETRARLQKLQDAVRPLVLRYLREEPHSYLGVYVEEFVKLDAALGGALHQKPTVQP